MLLTLMKYMRVEPLAVPVSPASATIRKMTVKSKQTAEMIAQIDRVRVALRIWLWDKAFGSRGVSSSDGAFQFLKSGIKVDEGFCKGDEGCDVVRV